MKKYRIITVEDTLELPVDEYRKLGFNILPLKVQSVITRLEAELPADEGIRTALRLGDSCLIIGEVRSKEAHALYEALGEDYEQLQEDYENLQDLWAEYNITHNITWQQFVNIKNLWAEYNLTHNITWENFTTYITQNYTSGYDEGWADAWEQANATIQQILADADGWNQTHYQQGWIDGNLAGRFENTTADLMTKNSSYFQAAIDDLLSRERANYTFTNRSELESFVANVTELSYLLDAWDNFGLEELRFIDPENDATYAALFYGCVGGIDVTRLPIFEQQAQDTITELGL